VRPWPQPAEQVFLGRLYETLEHKLGYIGDFLIVQYLAPSRHIGANPAIAYGLENDGTIQPLPRCLKQEIAGRWSDEISAGTVSVALYPVASKAVAHEEYPSLVGIALQAQRHRQRHISDGGSRLSVGFPDLGNSRCRLRNNLDLFFLVDVQQKPGCEYSQQNRDYRFLHDLFLRI
jgi:hypothetical protein